MKTLLLYIATLVAIQSAHGQFKEDYVTVDSCFILGNDTISGFILNRPDSQGEFTQLLRFKDNSPYPYGSIPSLNRTWYRTMFSGRFKDGKRYGEWVFWHDANNKTPGAYSYCGGANKHKIEYYSDSTTYSEGDYFFYKTITYNSDSTEISGRTGDKFSELRIKFHCNDECRFWDSKTNETILVGPRADFTLLFMEIEYEYLRK